jgi:hypothetical protein
MFSIFQATNQSNNNPASGGQQHPGQPGQQAQAQAQTPGSQTQQTSGQNQTQTSPMMGVNWGNQNSNNSNSSATTNATSPWAQEQQQVCKKLIKINQVLEID